MYKDSFGLTENFYKECTDIFIIVPLVILICYLLYKQDDELFQAKVDYYCKVIWKICKRLIKLLIKKVKKTYAFITIFKWMCNNVDIKIGKEDKVYVDFKGYTNSEKKLERKR